jgi:glycyl-tRNA synthetase
MYTETFMEELVSLSKRRGFIFQGSEIYGGLAGTYDYGPLGSLLKNNIRDSWIKTFVHDRVDMYLIDAAILMNQRVWQATGHVEEFSDPLVDDLVTNKRYRADHLLESNGIEHADNYSIDEMTALIVEKGIKSPEGNPLGPVKKFNMMMQTRVGAAEDSSAVSYLRPETAQGIFVNYKNVVDSMSPKLPFGIAQVGKAFRNEITPRDFIFRLRELEQMEIEYFIYPPSLANEKQLPFDELFDSLLNLQKQWLLATGLPAEKIHVHEHDAAARTHYSSRSVDYEFDFPFGQKELTGCAYRTDFDLSRHAVHSSTRLEYFDEDTKTHLVPHVIEPTFGLDRMVLAVLSSTFKSETLENGETRTWFAFPYHIAPYKACVSPLLKNRPELVEKAQSVFALLKKELGQVVYDESGNIGKRYRRQDEIGTPWCVVIDFETLGQESPDFVDTVTVRNRDTGEQERVAIGELVKYISVLK